ncbi:MAG: rhodanese-like domain-containing protein, partial [Gemmatimonadales bacterium]
MRRREVPDDYEYPEEEEDDESTGRWGRGRAGGRRWLKVLLFLLLIPLLLGAGVAVFAGRPIAFDAIRRLTDRKFPTGRWVEATELVRWRADPGRAQPVVLDARTEEEYAVSHLQNAVRIDPYRPILRPLRGFPKDTAIVLYSSVGYRGARVANFLERQGYT